jgi:integrase
LDAYQRTRDLYLADWARKPLESLTRQMVVVQHRKLTEERGSATANSVMRHLRSVYNFAAALFDDLPPNPVTILSQGRVWNREKRRRTLIPSHQLPVWWRAVWAETEDARDVLLLALFTGMRRTEIITLRWEMVDLVGKVLRLPITKNGDPLELPLSIFIADLLDQRRNRVGQSEWVFPSRSKTGHITETKTFTQRVSEASGVAFTMHDLRRTFITIAESLDIPAYALKRLLNHRADSDVTGGYIVINAERLREPVERIAQRIVEMADGVR